jgi:hypothetical protein
VVGEGAVLLGVEDFEQRGLAFRQEAVKLVKRRSPTEPA